MKKIKSFFMVHLIGVCFFSAFAADTLSQYQEAMKKFETHVSVYFSFDLNRSADFNKLTYIISLSHIDGNRMYAYANRQEFSEFIKENIDYRVEPHPGDNYSSKACAGIADQGLLNYDQYLALLQDYEKKYPSLCKVYEIGQSIKGKSISCLRITSGISSDYTNRPRFLIGCAIHGNELNGTAFSYKLMEYLLKGYSSGDIVAKRYLDSLEIWVAPHLNPDGTFPNGNTMDGCDRPNSKGTDLNRNFPAPSIAFASCKLTSGSSMDKETEALTSFELRHRFNFALDFHDGMNAIVYHWSKNTTVPVEDTWLKNAGGKYATTAGIEIGQAAVKWYPATGTRMDWQPYFNHCWGWTVEVGAQGTKLDGNWEKHKSAIFKTFDEALCGIHGTVTDGVGVPVNNVKIVLKKANSIWDKNGTESYSHEKGDFVHYAPEGIYDVEFTSGTKSKTVTGVSVVNGKATRLDVDLGTTSIVNQPNFVNEKIQLSTKNGGVSIHWDNSIGCPEIEVYSVNGTLLSKLITQNTGANSFDVSAKNCRIQTTGFYIVKIKVNNKVYAQYSIVM